MRAPALLALFLVALACADKGEPTLGHADPCELPQAPLLECDPPAVGDEPISVEDACRKLVECQWLPLERMDEGDTNPEDDEDYYGCVSRLQDNPPDRLIYSLRCIEVSTCNDLAAVFEGPCFIFGRDP